MSIRNVIILLLLLLGGLSAEAEVYKVDISSRELILGGQEFGSSGAYELLKGNIYFRFDPDNPSNSRITDIKLAETNDQGLVEAWSNLVVLKPVDKTRSSGIALVEVSNRGSKYAPSYFNRAAFLPASPGDWGDGLLMQLGLTVIWIGWQFDVPDQEGILKLHVPIARNAGGSVITGLVRSDWTLDHGVKQLKLGHRSQVSYPVADPADPVNILTVREGRDARRTVVQRDQWRFARIDGSGDDGKGNVLVVDDSTHIYMESGFEEGKIYELVYRAEDPPVVGLGLAAIRDVISYARHDPGSSFPVDRGIAFGVSQTGRFIRHFLYQGFNRDEQNRKAYDGLMVITAGAGRGSFNHRFAQPSRDAHRYSAFFYPTDIFPFASRAVDDPATGRRDGLLSHLDKAYWPRIFYINTGYEYWGRAASLIHTSVDGDKDVAPFENERIYHLASGQHYVDRFPPKLRDAMNGPMNGVGVYRGNPLDFSVNYRALLSSLVDWVGGNRPPPDSIYPRIADGTLVHFTQTGFPAIPGVDRPVTIHTAYRADYGPGWGNGVVDRQPPLLGKEIVPKVSRVDRYGNEIGGIRNVEARVPLATYTPWNLRSGFTGGSRELTDFKGTFIPFPKTETEKSLGNDPRPSIGSLYSSKAEYLKKVSTAVDALIDERFVLSMDKPYLLGKAAAYWEWIHEN